MQEVDLDRLFVGETNVRKEVGDLTELKLSIQEKGILQPLILRPVKSKLEVVVGARRFAAAKALGLRKVPAIVRELDEGEAIALSIVENIQRNDLELEEEAEAILKLMKLDSKRFGNYKFVAKAIGRSENSVRELIEAYELTFKLRQSGVQVKTSRAPSEEARRKAEAIPLKHTHLVARALKSEEVRKLSPREIQRKVPEIVRAIAPLPEKTARLVVDRFKMYPEKTVEKIKEEALARETGVSLKVYFPPRVARVLSQAADDRGIAEEELVSIAVEEWLVQKRYLKTG
jgi:ParB/RepB/Spo0J family partition protein